MKVRRDTKWIPSLYLESADPNCPNKFHYKSLSALNTTDSRSRSSVSSNTVREESVSILDIINEYAPSHNVEMEEEDLYPSKARSQRWPLSKKPTSISSHLWHTTQQIIDHPDITHKLYDDDDTIHNASNHENMISVSNGLDYDSIMDDLWFCAGKTLELSSSASSTQSDSDTDDIKHDHHDVISQIISKLINISFDSKCKKSIKLDLHHLNEDHVHDHDAKPLNLTKSPKQDSITPTPTTTTTGNTTRSSSVGTEADIMEQDQIYSSSHILSNEPSISYTVDDTNRTTPIPPELNHTTNTCALYEFLFDGVDTDTDDDDIFPNTEIEMNYRQSIEVTIDAENGSIVSKSSDVSQRDHNEPIKMHQNEASTYVPCRPLWELT